MAAGGILTCLACILAVSLPGCVGPSCLFPPCGPYYGDYFRAYAPGLQESMEAAGKGKDWGTRDGMARAPDWISNVRYHESRLHVFLTLELTAEAGNEGLRLRAEWQAYRPEAEVKDVVARFVEWAGADPALVDREWRGWCTQHQSCDATLELPRTSLAGLLRAADGPEADWDTDVGTTFEIVGPWVFSFEYPQRRETVDVGDYHVSVHSSATGIARFAVEWADRRDVQVGHQDGLAAALQAVEILGMPGAALKELTEEERARPPSLRERPPA